MICPKCHFANPEEMRFCGKCGTKVERICPKCHSPNPPDFIFCGRCGFNLAHSPGPVPDELSFEEKLAKIQRYLPGGLTEKILSQKSRIEGERREVTVMFCDLVDFTSLSERLGPEKTYTLMDALYEGMIHKVLDYGGTVNKLTGDGMMALYGAPMALEDAPQRAIRTALAIQREMTKFSDRIRDEAPSLFPVKMRIGIHSGLVVVGTVGNDLRVEFTALGDTVNLASRMEELAEPGTIGVTETTFKLTEGFFRFEALGEKEVKGRKAPVRVYRVLAANTRRTRFDVSAERGLTPLVGRERELELLRDGFQRAKSGRGQAFSIISEAGGGKSRLLYEFRKSVANEDINFLEGKCLSYSRGVAYHPVIDLLKSNFDIQEGEEDSQIRKKVKTGLNKLGLDEPSPLPYLLDLFSVKDSGLDQLSMSPEAKKDRIIEALKQIVIKGSEIRPLVLAFEDLHWIDRNSEEVAGSHLESIPGLRVLLIFTYRPEYVPPWGVRSYHNQLMLHRLSNRESFEMATHILGSKMVEKPLEELVLKKTEGVPLFIEELVRSLKDLKLIESRDGAFQLSKDIRSLTIPSTIQDMIMARVDTLPDDTRAVLQIGSVIEREFSHGLIARVTGLREKPLLRHLSILKDAELIYERGIFPRTTYVFKHALTREVVYDAVLLTTRKQIHERIGKSLEELYQAKIDDHYGALINHFRAGKNFRKTADYSRLACQKAENSMSLPEAIDLARMWINALETMAPTETLQEEIIEARTALGFYLFRMSNMAEAREAIDPIVDTVLKRAHRDRLGRLYVIIGSYKYMVDEDLPESRETLEKAMKISEETGDFGMGIYAKYMLGLVLAFNGDFEQAIEYFEMLLNLSVAMEFPWRVSAMKSNLSVYGYDAHGLVTQGYRTSEEAVQIAEESGDIYSKAIAYSSHGTSCYYRGLLEEAEHYLTIGINLTEKINMSAYAALAHQWLGHVYFDLEKYPMAQDQFIRVIAVREHSRLFPSSANLNRIALIRAKLRMGDRDIDVPLLIRYVRENKVRIYEGCMSRYIGDILLHLDKGHLAAAEEWIGKAIAADQGNRMRFDLGRDYVLCSEMLREKGESSLEKEFLKRAIEIFKECGSDGWARKTEKTLLKV